MSVCQRANGKWLVKYKDPAARKWLQRQFRTREEAEEFDAAAKVAATKDRPMTVREAVLAYVSNRNLSDSRSRLFERMLTGGSDGPGVARHLAERVVVSLNRTDLESVRERCRARGLRPSSINLCVGSLHSAFRWCASEDLVEFSPWEKYRINLPARTEHRTGTLEDLRRIYPHLPDWLKWAVRTALALCLRPGPAELFSLEWSAFDWRTGTVDVYMPKTKGRKSVFAPGWYMSEAWPRFEADRSAGRRLVCPGPNGRDMGGNRHASHWNRACAAAGVRMPMYALRHIAATEMLAAGADMAAVAAQLGHRRIETTAAFYTHALARAQRNAALAIPEMTEEPPSGVVSPGDGSGLDIGLRGRCKS